MYLFLFLNKGRYFVLYILRVRIVKEQNSQKVTFKLKIIYFRRKCTGKLIFTTIHGDWELTLGSKNVD